MNAPAYVKPFAGSVVAAGKQDLFVRTAGDPQSTATPAVFIHGLGGSSTNWTELMDLMAAERYCLAMDLPGFGQSPPPIDGDYTLRSHARVVADLIVSQLGNRRVHIFGNSMGGATAVQLAGRYPQLTKTLTLISPALPELLPRRTNIHMPVSAIPGVGERLMKRMVARDPQWRVNMTYSICYGDPNNVDPQRFRDQVIEVKMRDSLPHTIEAGLGSLRSIISSYFDYSQERPWRLARTVQAPTLLIYGRKDKLVNSKAAYRATKEFPNARVLVVPASGHVAQMEHPYVVADAWHELLRPN